jgi:hypothetical protein
MVITIRTTSVTPPGRSRKRVRRMSAFPPWFCNFPRALSLGFIRTFNQMALETSSPKAEVTGSNPVGCAIAHKPTRRCCGCRRDNAKAPPAVCPNQPHRARLMRRGGSVRPAPARL